MLSGKFITPNTFITKDEKFSVHVLNTYPKNVEKEDQNKLKANRKKEIARIYGWEIKRKDSVWVKVSET